MTKIIDGIVTLTFSEWEKRPECKEILEQMDVCDVCDGSGEHECECGNVHECHECDGNGKEFSLREIYESELRNEIKRLHAWKNGEKLKNPSESLIPLGHDTDIHNSVSMRIAMPGAVESKNLILTMSAGKK